MKSNLYTDNLQMYFCYPMLLLISLYGFKVLLEKLKEKTVPLADLGRRGSGAGAALSGAFYRALPPLPIRLLQLPGWNENVRYQAALYVGWLGFVRQIVTGFYCQNRCGTENPCSGI